MQKVIVAPSILAADFSRLADEVHRVEQAGADWIHCDVMDGHFVDNISFGPEIVGLVRKETRLPLDVHLMIQTPDHYASRFIKAALNSGIPNSRGARSEPRCRKNFARGSRRRLPPWSFLNPTTPFESVEPFLDKIDILLVMTVHPGFGGQSFRREMMEKVKRASEWKKSRGHKIDIEVDGGINAQTARLSIQNGANVLVAGTSIFHTKDYAKAIRDLRGPI